MPENSEGERTREQEPDDSFYQAARFVHDDVAAAVYAVAQEAIAQAECNLSALRFLLNHVPHVIVLGQRPPIEIEGAMQAILAAGEIVSLPDDVLSILRQRRAQAAAHGAWVEGHYRPGIRLSDRPDE